MRTSASISVWTIALAIAALTPRPAATQANAPTPSYETGALAAGDEVRVYWYDRYSTVSAFPQLRAQTLDLVRLEPGQLVGRRGVRIVVIDTGAVRSLQRRIGTRPASAPATVAGSAAGFAAAFLAGSIATGSDGGAVDAGLSAGVLVGAPLGALVAWLSSRSRGIYEEVSLPSASRP